MVTDTTTETFTTNVLESEKPVLVEFGATWCQPCKMMKPILDKFSAEYENQISVTKIDVDENNALATEYGVTSVPTFIVFNGGKPEKQFTGAKPQPALVKELAEYLN